MRAGSAQPDESTATVQAGQTVATLSIATSAVKANTRVQIGVTLGSKEVVANVTP